MQLEDYFEFLEPDDIRIKGHRIGIDNVLEYYLQGCSPEQIIEHFPSLNFEKVYAILTYYWRNKDEMDAYMRRLQDWREKRYQEWAANPSPAIARLRTQKEKV